MPPRHRESDTITDPSADHPRPTFLHPAPTNERAWESGSSGTGGEAAGSGCARLRGRGRAGDGGGGGKGGREGGRDADAGRWVRGGVWAWWRWQVVPGIGRDVMWWNGNGVGGGEAGAGGLSWRLGGCGLGCGAVEWCCLVNFFPAVNSLSAERGVEGWVLVEREDAEPDTEARVGVAGKLFLSKRLQVPCPGR